MLLLFIILLGEGMKKILLCLITILLVCGCSIKETDSDRFIKDYESLNGKSSSYGEYRELDLDDNPYIYSNSDEIVKMIENKETFYVYFGDKACPWCRSIIEKSISVSKKYGVDKIYYVYIWDDDHNEILRDKYEIQNGNIVKVKDGDKNYSKLLTHFGNLLSDYTLTDSDGTIRNVGEKRIFAPNFIYVEKGVAKRMTDGISSKQSSPFGELTDEILKDEEKKFDNFFGADMICDDKC